MFNVESEGNMAKKVLVVDDEKLIVKGIRFSLEQDGMEVISKEKTYLFASFFVDIIN